MQFLNKFFHIISDHFLVPDLNIKVVCKDAIGNDSEIDLLEW